MKLRNKLLPLVGVSAIAATAIPLSLTSCNKNDVTMVDITNGYTPTIEKHVGTALGQQATNKEYFDGIETNGKIFTEDYIYGKHLTWQNFVQQAKSQYSSLKINSLKVGVNTPTFGSVSIAYPGEPAVTYPTISVTYKTEADMTIEVFDEIEQTYTKTNTVASYTVTYDNVPFFVQPDSYNSDTQVTGYWYASLAWWTETPWVYNYNLSDWSIDYDYAQTVTTTVAEMGKASTKTIENWSKSDTINTPEGMKEMFGTTYKTDDPEINVQTAVTFGYPSYYLSDITQVPELSSAGTVDTTVETMADSETSIATVDNVRLGTSTDTDGTYDVDFNDSAVQMTLAMDEMIIDKSGKITLYSDIDSEGELSTDPITFYQIDAEDDDENTTMTIAAGTALEVTDGNKAKGDGDFDGFYGYGLPEAQLKKSKTYDFSEETDPEPVTKTYKFQMPKYIVAKVEIDGLEIAPQKVYLNQDITEVTVTYNPVE